MAKNNKLKPARINIKNKRAEHDYFVIDRLTAGIVLTGTEIKSIRLGKAGLVDTFCFINNGEMWVKNMYVAEYSLVLTIATSCGATANFSLIRRRSDIGLPRPSRRV